MAKESQTGASWFDKLSDSALVKLDKIVKTPNNHQPIVDTSPSTWWRWVATGAAPKPVRPTAGTTFWRVSDLRRWLSNPEEFLLGSGRKKAILRKRSPSSLCNGPAGSDQSQADSRFKIAAKVKAKSKNPDSTSTSQGNSLSSEIDTPQGDIFGENDGVAK